MKRILITGASGQIGTELSKALIEKYGNDNVVHSDIKRPDSLEGVLFIELDVCDAGKIDKIITEYRIDTIYHLAALLSATGERNPQLCWDININGTINILEAAVKHKLERIFIPSSIAVWGKHVPPVGTPQNTVLKPSTMYGVTKVAGELLADYYFSKFGLDVRGIRYPGIISSETLPGGGTTDYAVEIFYKAIENNHYDCFLKEDSTLPMMYMPDCVKATIDLMEADIEGLENHGDFNVAAFSFNPAELAEEIKKHIPGFTISYSPDYRQQIADSWPQSIDDSEARRQWGWMPEHDLASMTKDMIEKLSRKL